MGLLKRGNLPRDTVGGGAHSKLVSVVVTTRNSARTLEVCLSSVRRQNHGEIELIVVDNSSTDGTTEIAERYANQVVLGGPERSAQRNMGASIASADFLLFIDADMELTPKVVQRCWELADQYDALIIPERTVGIGWLARTRDLERLGYAGSFYFEAARFMRRETFTMVGGYDPRMTGPEDYDLEARLEERKLRVGHVDEVILHHEEGATLGGHLRKRMYYARSVALYSEAHPQRARTQFGGARLLYYARNLGSSPASLAQVLALKAMEYVAASLHTVGHEVTREEVY